MVDLEFEPKSVFLWIQYFFFEGQLTPLFLEGRGVQELLFLRITCRMLLRVALAFLLMVVRT